MKKIKNNLVFSIVTLLLFSMLLSGCSYSIGMYESEMFGKIDMSYSTFNDQKEHVEKLNAGQTLVMDYSVTVKKGKLTINVLDPDGKELFNNEFTESKKDKVSITAQKSGKYKICVKGEMTSGGCHIKLSKK